VENYFLKKEISMKIKFNMVVVCFALISVLFLSGCVFIPRQVLGKISNKVDKQSNELPTS